MQLNTVVLPAPLGPISAVMPARPTVNDRSLTATRPPKRMLRWSTRSSGGEPARALRSLSGMPGRVAPSAGVFIRLPHEAATLPPCAYPAGARRQIDIDGRAGKSTVHAA